MKNTAADTQQGDDIFLKKRRRLAGQTGCTRNEGNSLPWTHHGEYAMQYWACCDAILTLAVEPGAAVVSRGCSQQSAGIC
jgi:hypothetical protein